MSLCRYFKRAEARFIVYKLIVGSFEWIQTLLDDVVAIHIVDQIENADSEVCDDLLNELGTTFRHLDNFLDCPRPIGIHGYSDKIRENEAEHRFEVFRGQDLKDFLAKVVAERVYH